MSKRRMILNVRKRGKVWVVKASKCIDGWTLDDSPKSHADAVDAAFGHAKKIKGAVVRIYDANNKLETEVNSVGVANYVPGSHERPGNQ